MAAEELIIPGLVCMGIAGFLFYRLLRSRGPGDEMSRLELRTNQLKDLIKTTRLDFYKRRIEGDKADKLIREYEEELSLAGKQIEGMRKKYGRSKSPQKISSPANIATLLGAVGLLLVGIFLVLGALAEQPDRGGPDFYDNGFADGSPTDCSSIADPDERDDCYEGMIRRAAGQDPKEAARFCSMLQDPGRRDECYMKLSYKVTDQDPLLAMELCGEIQDEMESGDCYWNLLQENDKLISGHPDKALEFCSLVPDMDSDDCFYMVAESLRDQDVQKALQACLGIGNANRKDDCLFSNVIRDTDNATLLMRICKGHISANRREDCFRTACSEDFITGNPEGARGDCCGSMANSGDCYIRIATFTARSNLDFALETCGMVKGGPFGRPPKDCYKSIMQVLDSASEKVQVCQGLNGAWDEQDCLNELMWSAKTCQDVLDVCESQEDDFCAMRGIIDNDYGRKILECPQTAIDVCLDLDSDQQASNCLHRVASTLASNNPSMAKKACNEIEDEWQKDSCKDQL